MSQDVRILITASLNKGLSIGEINKKIQEISKSPSLQSIKIKIDIDSKILQTLQNFNKNINQINKANSVQRKTTDEITKSIRQETKAINDATSAQKKLNLERQKIVVDPASNKPISTTSTYGNNLNNNKRTITTLEDGAIKGNIVDTTNAKKDLADYNKMLDQAYRMNAEYNKKSESLDRAHFDALKSNKKRQEDMEKLHYLALQQNRQRDINFQQSVASQQARINDMVRRFGSDSKVNNQLTNLNRQLNDIRPIGNYKNALNGIGIKLREISATAATARSNTLSLSEAMSTAVSRTLTWTLATTAIFGTKRAIEEMLAVIIEVDTEMTSLRKVMNADTDFEFLLDSATESAREFGRTITGALQAYNSFAKMGFDERQVENLGRAAMLLSTVGEIEDRDSAEFLTSTLLQFNMAVEESSKIVDSWNEVSNNFAVTSLDLAQGISRSGQAASTAKVSFDELNGMITAIQASTRRGGAQIGNSLKTIFTRLRMSEVEDALGEIGIAVYDLSGDFRSATDIFTQLSTQWSSLNSVQKSFISEQIAGKFHINNFMALMNSYGMSLDATTSSQESAGSATRELATFQESLKFQINNLTASFQNLSLAVGNGGLTDAFVFVLKTLTALSDGFASLTESTNGWNIKLPLYAAGVYGLVKAFGALRLAITGVKMSLGLIGIALVAVEAIASLFMGATKSTEINTQAFIDNASEIKANSDNLQGLIDKHNELKPLAETNTEKQAELQSVLKEINDIAPQLITNTEAYGGALALNEEAAKTYIATLKEMNKEQLKQAQLSNDIQLSKAEAELEEFEAKLNKFGSSSKDTFEKISQYQEQFGAKTTSGGLENYRKMIQAIMDEQDKLYEQGKTEEAYSLGFDIEKLRVDFMDFVDLVDKGTGTLEKYSETVSKRNTSQQQVKSLQDQKKAINDQLEGREQLNAAFQKADGYIDEETGAWVSNTEAQLDYSKAREEQNKKMEETISTLSSLSSAYDTLSEGEQLSADTVIDLIDQYPTLSKYLAETNDLTFKKGELLKEVAETDRQARIVEFENSLKSVEVTRNELTAKQDLYKQFYQKLVDAGSPMDNWMVGSVLTNEEEAALNAANQQANDLKAKIAALSQPLTFYGGSSKASSSKKDKSGSKDEAKQISATESRINAINAQAVAQSKLNEQLSSSISSDSTLATQLAQTTALIASQTKETTLLEAANKKLLAERSNLQTSNSKYNMSSWIDANGEATESYVKLYNSMKSGSAQDSLQSLYDQFSQYTLAVRGNKQSIQELIAENNKLNISLDDIKLSNTQAFLEKRAEGVSKYDDALKKSQQVQSRYAEDSEGWKKEQENQVKILEQKREALQKENEWIRTRLKQNEKAKKSEKLTTDQIKLLNEQLVANSDAWYDTVGAIKSSTDELEAYHDKIYEDIKQKELDYIDEVMDAEDKRHDKRIDDLDKEMDKFQESVDLVRKTMSRDKEEEDFNKQLAKSQEEELAIRTRISALALDDSLEAKYKKQKLEEELAAKVEDIEQMKNDRTYKLREDNLTDLVEQKQKEIDAEKAKEDTLYESNKANLERMKLDVTAFWDSIIENENTHLLNQQTIIDNHLKAVESSLKAFATSASSISQGIGQSLSNAFKGIANGIDMSGAPASSSTVIDQMQQNSAAWNSSSASGKKALEAANQKLGASIGATYDPKTGTWSRNGVKLYHTGGEVGVEGTTSKKWYDKILKSNEIPAILKKGEVVLDQPMKFIHNLASQAMSNISPKQPQAASSSPSTFSFENLIRVDRIDKVADVDAIFDQVARRFNQLGIPLR